MVACSGEHIGSGTHSPRSQISQQELFDALQEIRFGSGSKAWQGAHRRLERSREHTDDAER